MAVNSIARAHIDERTKKQAATVWLQADAKYIAQALDESALVFARASEFGRSRSRGRLKVSASL
jgi:hypothetical protein